MSNFLFLAQQFGNEFGAEPPPEFFAGIAVFIAIVFLVCYGILALIAYLLYTCFERIPPEHREMDSWQVFLLLIPCFNIVWNFFVYPKLGRSYQRYFASIGRTDVGDCGEQIGLWYAICCVAQVVPLVNYIAGPAGLVLLIIYLIKALSLKGQIGQAPPGGGFPPQSPFPQQGGFPPQGQNPFPPQQPPQPPQQPPQPPQQ